MSGPGPSQRAAKRARMEAGAAAAAAQDCSRYTYDAHNVFAAMQAGTVPVEALFDRPATLAVLDRQPSAPGHALLIVKTAAATLLEDMPADVAASIVPDLQALVRAVQAATGCAGVRVQQNNGPAAGQAVRQLHWHVLPAYGPAPTQPAAPAAAAAESEAQPPGAPAGAQPAAAAPPAPAAPPHDGPGAGAAPEEPQQGPLLARIRNRLPPAYSGPGCHVWVPCADSMEQLGMHLQPLLQPGTVVLLSGQLGSGKTSIARGCIRAWCRDPHMHVPSPSFLLNLTYQQDTGYEQQNTQGEAGAPCAQQQQQQQPDAAAGSREPPPAIHHMDPYRCGPRARAGAGRASVCACACRHGPAPVAQLPCAAGLPSPLSHTPHRAPLRAGWAPRPTRWRAWWTLRPRSSAMCASSSGRSACRAP